MKKTIHEKQIMKNGIPYSNTMFFYGAAKTKLTESGAKSKRMGSSIFYGNNTRVVVIR